MMGFIGEEMTKNVISLKCSSPTWMVRGMVGQVMRPDGVVIYGCHTQSSLAEPGWKA